MLQAGFARIDITPPFGNDLSGYYERRLADGTLDPLFLNAVALTVGEETVLLMAADYIGIKMDHSIAIRKLISERTGVPIDHILLSALHQHTSPCLADPTKRETALRDKVFIDVVYRRFADAAMMALDDRADAEPSVAAREVAEPIAFVRRYFTKEAGVVTNPSSQFTLTGRCADADNTVRLVRFARKDTPPTTLTTCCAATSPASPSRTKTEQPKKPLCKFAQGLSFARFQSSRSFSCSSTAPVAASTVYSYSMPPDLNSISYSIRPSSSSFSTRRLVT